MADIETFGFNRENLDQIKNYKFGKNWPVVYILENGQEVYIGETIRVHQRTKEHLDNPERKNLKNISSEKALSLR